jgi:hypothetical protein
MARNRFVQPATKTLELSDGDWVEVKERLTYGEQQTLAGGALGRATGMFEGKPEVALDMARYQIKRFAIWIVDWSFTDAKGKRVPVSEDAIANLDPDTAQEIDDALTDYIEAMDAEKKAMKAGES